jgi:hypothetical protein
MLKYQPRKFYQFVLGADHPPPAATPATFASRMGELFLDPAADPEVSPVTPITDFPDITALELADVLARSFKGNVSSGMCPLPSQVVKHMAGDALEPLAAFLNQCVKAGRPPTTWRQLKLVPLYKKEGDPSDPDNYRALAVGHPLAKLAMGVINKRLTAVAEDQQLRAPTQAGFRAGHTVEDLALVL